MHCHSTSRIFSLSMGVDRKCRVAWDTQAFQHLAEFYDPPWSRVIVTPAVYWSFVPLKRAFRYQHWAGFSGRTKPFDLAATYVLVKQSGLPCHCDQPLARLAPLIPKVGS